MAFAEERPGERIVVDDLTVLLDDLPPRVREPLLRHTHGPDLLEVVLDLGREPEARYPGREVLLSDEPVTDEDLQYVVTRVGSFGEDNRGMRADVAEAAGDEDRTLLRRHGPTLSKYGPELRRGVPSAQVLLRP